MNAKIRYGLSAAVLALIAAGAPAPDILDQFLDEKEGNHTTAYRDGAGIWTICRGAILVDGKPVVPGMKLSKEKCDRVNAIERDKALAWVEKNIRVPLSEPQKRVITGIASTPSPDRDGDILEPEGAEFGSAIPFLWQHDHSRPVGQCTVRRVSEGLEITATLVKPVPDMPSQLAARLPGQPLHSVSE